ncbi:MAG: DUF2811 domain-containing protein [Leptolyngbyaceae cyanobacterium bins.302]|nr:DUF2811 domain-containing protein [Leptolyngbyaceae cyanobacterium bins.302]
MNITVSILTEIPEDLYEAVSHYLEAHRDWDQDRVFATAVSLFLAQNNDRDRNASKTYLDKIFQQSV